MAQLPDELQCKKDQLALANIRYHIFLCCDQTKPNCCQREQGLASWDYLKRRLHELNLTPEVGVHRSKANCLRVCCHGPIAVIYPQGIWYHSCSKEVLETIIQQHIILDKPVEKYILSELHKPIKNENA